MRKLVGGTDNEGIECVFWIKRVVDRLEIQAPLSRRSRSLEWSLFRDIDHTDITEAGVMCRLNDNVNMIVQPILEKRVRDTNVKRFVVVFDELCRFEPGVVTLLIDFLLNDIEN